MFGDSFVEGFRSCPDVEKYTEKNICYYLSKELGIEVSNQGKRGASNQSIGNNFFRWLSQKHINHSEWMVLFVWSECIRPSDIDIDMRDDDELKRNFEDPFYVSGAHNQRNNVKIYTNPAFKRMHFEQAMHSCRMVCEDYNIPFLMTSSVTNEYFLNRLLHGCRPKKSGEKFDVQPIDFLFARAKVNWIEPHKPNNSMLDIISDTWLTLNRPENVSELKAPRLLRERGQYETYMTKCLHPTDLGNKLIAETLSPYIRKRLNERV